MSVQLGSGGKVLLGPSGTVAVDPDCCCETSCSRSLSFEINIDPDQTGTIYVAGVICACAFAFDVCDRTDLTDLIDTGGEGLFVRYNIDTGDWTLESTQISLLNLVVNSPITPETWNSVTISLSTPVQDGLECPFDSCCGTATLTVNGDSDSHAYYDENGIGGIFFVGNIYSAGNYSLRSINFASQVSGESSFSYSTDSFDYNTAGITFPGGDVVRVDSAVNNEYAAKLADDAWQSGCCYCPPLSLEATTHLSASGSVPQDEEVSCTFSITDITSTAGACFPAGFCGCSETFLTDTQIAPNDGESCDYHQDPNLYSLRSIIVDPHCEGDCGESSGSDFITETHLTRDIDGWHVTFRFYAPLQQFCGTEAWFTTDPATGITVTEDLGVDPPIGLNTFSYVVDAISGVDFTTVVGTFTVGVDLNILAS